MMNFTVTTFQEKYRDAFKTLNEAWIRKYFKLEPKDVEQINAPEECLRLGGQVFFVLSQDDVPVGTCALYRLTPTRYELAKMAVDPAFQGHGLGDKLMVASEEWARLQNASEILILSNTILEPAINLYKKHGYKTVHLGPHSDYERCNIEMTKRL